MSRRTVMPARSSATLCYLLRCCVSGHHSDLPHALLWFSVLKMYATQALLITIPSPFSTQDRQCTRFTATGWLTESTPNICASGGGRQTGR